MEFILSNLYVTEADRTEDGQWDVITILKRDYKSWVKRMIQNHKIVDLFATVPSKDMVRVYHGTSTSHLHDILTYGLQPRSVTNRSNWNITHNGENLASIDDVVYVTTKWHYYYANVVARQNKEAFPCYIAFDIPKSALIPDEDAFHSKLSSERFWTYFYSKGRQPFHLSGEESLLFYHTASIPLGIPLSCIKEVTVLGDHDFLTDILSPSSTYSQCLEEWSQGRLEREVKMSSLYKKMNRSSYNRTFPINAKSEESLVSSKMRIQLFLDSLPKKVQLEP